MNSREVEDNEGEIVNRSNQELIIPNQQFRGEEGLEIPERDEWSDAPELDPVEHEETNPPLACIQSDDTIYWQVSTIQEECVPYSPNHSENALSEDGIVNVPLEEDIAVTAEPIIDADQVVDIERLAIHNSTMFALRPVILDSINSELGANNHQMMFDLSPVYRGMTGLSEHAVYDLHPVVVSDSEQANSEHIMFDSYPIPVEHLVETEQVSNTEPIMFGLRPIPTEQAGDTEPITYGLRPVAAEVTENAEPIAGPSSGQRPLQTIELTLDDELVTKLLQGDVQCNLNSEGKVIFLVDVLPTTEQTTSKEADIVEFLSGLPSYNEKNFSAFFNEPSLRYNGKLSVYLSTEDRPPQQVIIPERSNVLLRYLHQQWLKKNYMKKRDFTSETQESCGSNKKRRTNS